MDSETENVGILICLHSDSHIARHPCRLRMKDELLMTLSQSGMAMPVFITKCK